MRNHIMVASLLLITFIALSFGKTPDKNNLSKDIPADYYIEAELDTSGKTLTGIEQIRFLNPTDRDLSIIILHLYPNAFKDTSTTMANSGENMKARISDNRSYIECDPILVNGSEPDSVVIDETLLFIYLKEKLKPNGKLNISLKFEILIPRIYLRLGYDKNGNYLLSHWHPILAGYQKNKAMVFQYGYNGEFFSNFSNYEVRLKIPEGFKLSSTSNINEPDSTIQGIAYYNLPANRVIDFAFACGPAWKSETYYHKNAAINILYLPQNEKNLSKFKEYIDGSLEYFGNMFYAYPYSNLSYVDFNPGAGGMELPRMVVMSFKEGPYRKNDVANTVIHEMAHQWFYAAVATNEYDEPWLDEGIVTYLTERAMKDILGETFVFDFYGIKLSFLDFGAFITRETDVIDPLALSSDEFYEGHYYFNIYGRAASTLNTLEGVLGTETFDKALKDFANEFKFKHPDSYDFKESIEQSAGQDLSWFFGSYIFGTSRVDYEISSLNSEKTENLYHTKVELKRAYDGVLPQQVIIKFKDGSIQSKDWDGLSKYMIFEFESERPAAWAAIDTANFYLIDEDFANNSLKLEPENGRIFGLASLMVALVEFLMIFVGLL